MEKPDCRFNGNPDMYGIGIRIGFYLQWNAVILAAWLAPTEVDSLRWSNAIFGAATFLALFIQTIQDALHTVEIYTILLLTFGSSLWLVPLFIWRLLTCCDPLLDPSRFPITKSPSPVYAILNALLVIAVLAFQLWFWIVKAEKSTKDGCDEFGFFFAKFRLNSVGFRVLNILFSAFIFTSCIVLLVILVLIKLGWKKSHSQPLSRKKRKSVRMLRIVGSILKLVAAAVVIAGTELTVAWNDIQEVNDLSSAGQIIPLALGLAIIARVLYVRFLKAKKEKSTPVGRFARWCRVESWRPERIRPGPVHGYDLGPHDIGSV